MTLGEKIVFYRKKIGMSQEALAEKLNVSRQAISKWETGDCEPELSKIKALSLLFGITLDDFLSQNLQNDGEIQKIKMSTNSVGRVKWHYLSYLVLIFLLIVLSVTIDVRMFPSFYMRIDITNISRFLDPFIMVLMTLFFILMPFGAGLIRELGLSFKAMFFEINLSDDEKELCYKSTKLSLLGIFLGIAFNFVISLYKLSVRMSPSIESFYGVFISSISCVFIYGILFILAILPVYVFFSKRK